ncbi:TPA: ATP-binding protein [Campylobacter jejuni]|nr:ATP-binding protein [Campylobacter jejuni]HDZ5005193.1 ATP-binding protein [Campylobacter jejuni]HDZ5008994.1 ATP-binding protein [Campylobacter jejuni]HDZ5012383.1 ATP-binding protein [Campylobacter jejuni]HDZ5015730.1 ATP-binding protein [Campylobacter jejuni]
MKRKNIKFNNFVNSHKTLSLNRLFDFYSVFEGFKNLNILNFEEDIFVNIERILLDDYFEIKSYFALDETSSYAFTLLAKNNRKRFSINRKIQHFKALSTLKYLLETGIIKLEYSKEAKKIKDKRQKIKKELRSYVIQDKIMFSNHFTRFFFYFLKPNEKLILQNRYEEVLEYIKEKFELYQSFCFEQLSRELLEKKFNINGVQSYWDKNLELDLYYQDENLCFIGEVKFKNKKICKNILNLLKLKAKSLNLIPNYYIIISKSGFSKEFDKICEQKLLLLDLNDFKILLEE